MRELRITVPGRPVPKARPRFRADLRGGRVRIRVYTPADTRRYEEQVRTLARLAAGGRPLQGPVEVEVRVCVAPGRRLDLDNAIKGVIDGLRRAAFADDRQVVRIVAERVATAEGEERVEVTVRSLGGENSERGPEADRRRAGP